MGGTRGSLPSPPDGARGRPPADGRDPGESGRIGHNAAAMWLPYVEYHLRPLPGFALVQPWLEVAALCR